MNIAVDVGTVKLKGVNSEGRRVIFDSQVSPATDLVLADVSPDGDDGYTTQIKSPGSDTEQFFVGEKAIREGRNVGFNLERDKYMHENHNVLLLTAVRLLLGQTQKPEPVSLAVGLPIGYYRQYKNELKRKLSSVSAYVSVNNLESVMIEFQEVQVYPQGVGALFALDEDLPDSGLVGVVDPGGGTTEYLLVEIRNGKAYPISNLSGSIEIGTYSILSSVSDEYRKVTGGFLDTVRAEDVVRTGRAYFRGKEIDMSYAVGKARQNTAKEIADNILAEWKKVADVLRRVYLVGGGTLEMKCLTGLLPAAVAVPDPQWSNVVGFLNMLTRQGVTP